MQLSTPHSQRLGATLKGQHSIVAFVISLFQWQRPLDVIRLIITIVVNAFERVFRGGAIPYVGTEILKRISPTAAHCYTSFPVVLKRFYVGIFGTRNDVRPNTVHLGTAVGGETGVQFITDSAVRISVQAMEFSGVSSGAAEGVNTASGSNSESAIDGIIPTSPINLVVAMSAFVGNEYAGGPIEGFTRIGTGTGGGSVYQEAAYLIQSAATNTGTTWTLNNPVDWAASGIALGAA